MTPTEDRYANFAEHPRYGRRPQITGTNPHADFEGGVFLHWHSPKECRVPDTAIAADVARQVAATVPVTHYFDVERSCRDCARPFLFFAAEQKYWYEELGFPLESDCVRCSGCRNARRGLDRKRQRYEVLFHLSVRTVEEDLELIDGYLSLAEASLFQAGQLHRMREILKGLPPDLSADVQAEVTGLRDRIKALEA